MADNTSPQFVDYNSVSPFLPLPSYYSGQAPSSGGWTQNNNSGGMGGFMNSFGGQTAMGLLSGLGPITHLFGGLFGGNDGPTWQPYAQNGQYYWNDPSQANPVPIANVPGATLKPSKVYRQTAQGVQAITDLLPYYNQAVNATILPNALAQLQASAATSPLYAQLTTDLYNRFGPQLNAIGNEINRRNMLAQASSENQVLQGPGKDLVNSAYDLSQVFDKPYYDTRQSTANQIGNLYNSIDLSGGLSPTERDEIAKGLYRNNAQTGVAYSPSQSQTIANAMQYGQAGYGRKIQAQNQLTSAIQAANQFLPQSKSGVDVFQVATGRSSMPNTGNALFTGAQQGNASTSLGQQMFGGINQLQNTDMNNQTQLQLQRNQMNNWQTILGSVSGAVGKLGGGLLGGI